MPGNSDDFEVVNPAYAEAVADGVGTPKEHLKVD